jgi:hypothetical protein
VADLFKTLSELNPDLLVLGWLALIALHVFALIGMMRRRATAKARREADVLSAQLQAEPASRTISTDTSASQIQRLFGILETSAASVERAMSAHRAAARQLDSAEYQLLRLFDEFPMLAASRGAARLKASVSIVAPATAVRAHALAA